MKRSISLSLILIVLISALVTFPVSANTSQYTTPTITSFSNRMDGTELQLSKDARIKYLRVFVREGNKWKKLGDTSSIVFLHRGAKVGVTYQYAVRGMSNDKKKYVTDYKTWRFKHQLPGIKKSYVVFSENGTKASLCVYSDMAYSNKNCKYQVYIKDENNRWRLITITKATKFNLPIIYKNNHFYIGNIRLDTPETDKMKARGGYIGLFRIDIEGWKLTARAIDDQGNVLTPYYKQYSKTYVWQQ